MRLRGMSLCNKINLYKMCDVKWKMNFSMVLKFLQRISICRVDEEANSITCGKLCYVEISSPVVIMHSTSLPLAVRYVRKLVALRASQVFSRFLLFMAGSWNLA